MTLESLIHEHGRMIWRVAYRFLRNIEDARDVTQDVLLKLHRSFPRLTGRINFEAWLYRVTANEALNARRAASRRSRLDEAAGDLAGRLAVHARTGLKEDIASGIRSLPRQQRAAVTLRLIEGLTFSEIAGAFGVSEGTAKVHFTRGMKKLRESLAGWK